MARLPSSLREVGCRKLNCRTGSDTLHRHHKRHQAMWIGVWYKEWHEDERYKALVAGYWAFRTEDIVFLCDCHHAEIHNLYDGIIRANKLKIGKPLRKYTWAEANALMDELEAACLVWLKTETPGMQPGELQRNRKLLQQRTEKVVAEQHKQRKRRKRRKRRPTRRR